MPDLTLMPSTQSDNSHTTSPSNSAFGDRELVYLSRVSTCLQNPPEPEAVRMWLGKAVGEGLDPQRIYDAAVRLRPPHWTAAPPFSDVDPTTA